MSKPIQTTSDNDRLLTIETVAAQLGLRPKTVNQFVRDGKLGCVQLTRRDRRITRTQLEEFIESRTVEPPKKVVDPRAAKGIPFPRKGGDTSKSRGSGVGLLRKEIHELCQ